MVRMALIRLLGRNELLRRAVVRVDRGRSGGIVRQVRASAPVGQSIVDVGCGLCNVCRRLKALGYRVEPVDIVNISIFPEIQPTIYDGKRLPFADGRYNVALLATVLHHTPDPAAVLREAARVADRVILIEEIYRGRWQKVATFAMDSLLNLEFRGHPHTNQTDTEWRAIFRDLGLRVERFETHQFWRLFTSATYVLAHEGGDDRGGDAPTAHDAR